MIKAHPRSFGAIAAATLALLAASPVRAADFSHSFGVPDNPQPPPGYPPQGYPQPGLNQPQPNYPQPNYPQPGLQPPAYPQPAYPQPGYPPAPSQPFAGTPQPQQPQQSPGQQPAMSIQQFLVSTWQGQTKDGDGAWNVMIVFRPDNTFMQAMILNNGQFQLSIMGQYDAQLGPDGGLINLHPAQWNPRQVCNGGQCKPLNLPPTIPIRFKPLSHDQFQVEGGVLQRVGPPS